MSSYHKYKVGDEYIKIKKDNPVDLTMFHSARQVEVAVSYSLLSRRRITKFNNGYSYGQTPMYFPFLYDMLSRQFNNGLPIIDRYMKNLGRYAAGRRIKELTQEIADELVAERNAIVEKQILAKHGGFDKRFKVFARLREFESIKKRQFDNLAREIESYVQSDIYRRMSIGLLPLEKSFVTAATVAARKRAGFDIPENVVFFTTGQLASSIRLHFEIQLKEQGAAYAV